jgi:hypothetical protein
MLLGGGHGFIQDIFIFPSCAAPVATVAHVGNMNKYWMNLWPSPTSLPSFEQTFSDTQQWMVGAVASNIHPHYYKQNSDKTHLFIQLLFIFPTRSATVAAAVHVGNMNKSWINMCRPAQSVEHMLDGQAGKHPTTHKSAQVHPRFVHIPNVRSDCKSRCARWEYEPILDECALCCLQLIMLGMNV